MVQYVINIYKVKIKDIGLIYVMVTTRMLQL